MRAQWLCNCRSIWCRLDAVARCRSRWICDRHDRHIIGPDRA